MKKILSGVFSLIFLLSTLASAEIYPVDMYQNTHSNNLFSIENTQINSFDIEDFSLMLNQKSDSEFDVTINQNYPDFNNDNRIVVASFAEGNTTPVSMNLYPISQFNIEIDVSGCDYSEIFIINSVNDDSWIPISDCHLYPEYNSIAKATFNFSLTEDDRENNWCIYGQVLSSFSIDNNNFSFFCNDATEEHPLSENAIFRINGIEYDIASVQSELNRLDTYYTGTVTITDRMGTGTNTFDELYDTVELTFYYFGIVDKVVSSELSTKILFKDSNHGGSITIDNSNSFYSATLNEESCSLTDFMENDIILFSYSYDKSNDFNIRGTRNIVNGTVESISKEGFSSVVVIDGYNYLCNDFYGEIGSTYNFYLNDFNGIVYWEIDVSTLNYGIINEVFYDSASGNNYACVVLPDGTTNYFILPDESILIKACEIAYGQATPGNTLQKLRDRCIKYTLDYNNGLTAITQIPMSQSTASFNKKSNRIGIARLSDNSKIVDLSQISNAASTTSSDFDAISLEISDFKDEQEYSILYGDKVDDSYLFVIVTAGTDVITASDKLSVIESISLTEDNKGHNVYTANIFTDGNDASREFTFSNNMFDFASTLNPGDAITFSSVGNIITNSSLLFSHEIMSGPPSINAAYNYMSSNALNNSADSFYSGLYLKSGISSWDESTALDTQGAVRIAFGAILDKTSYSMDLAIIKKDKTTDELYSKELDDTYYLNLSKNPNVYIYNTNDYSVSRGILSDVLKTNISYSLVDSDDDGLDYYNWSTIEEDVPDLNYAFVKTVNNEITDIYYIDNSTPYVPRKAIKSSSIFSLKLTNDTYKNTLKLTHDFPYDGNYKIMLAYYNGNRLIQVRMVSESEKTISQQLPSVTKMKAFIVNNLNELLPLSNSEMIDYAFSGNSVTSIITQPTEASENTIKYNIAQLDNADNNSMDFIDESSEKATSYRLSNDVIYYVNGFLADYIKSPEFFYDKFGTIMLSDTNNDGQYDYVSADTYYWAVVDTVYNNKIYFEDSELPSNSCSLNIDDKLSYSIEKNGIEIPFTDLEEGDVLSIKYDEGGKLSNSPYYKIIVSDNKLSGKVSMISTDNGQIMYTINGQAYTCVHDALGISSAGAALKICGEYILSLDIFGRIVGYEEQIAPSQYGIIDRVYMYYNTGDVMIRIIQGDGSRVSYVAKTYAIIMEASNIAYNSANQLDGNLTDLSNRFVTFTLNAANEINSIESLSISQATGEFSSADLSVSTAKISSKTVVLNISDAYSYDGMKDVSYYTMDDIKSASVSTFVDGEEYSILYADKRNDGTYNFVAIIDGNFGIKIKSGFAVVDSVSVGLDENGIELYKLSLYTPNSDKITHIYISNDAPHLGISDIKDISRGSIIAYNLDDNGYIDYVTLIGNVIGNSDKRISPEQAYDYCSNNIYSKNDDPLYVPSYQQGLFLNSNISAWDDTVLYRHGGYARVAFGAIVEKTSESIDLAIVQKANNDEISDVESGQYYSEEFDNIYSLDFASDVNVYIYDYNEKSSNRISKGSIESIEKTLIPYSLIGDNDGNDVYNWSELQDNYDIYANYAFVKTLNGDITDILVIIPYN